MSGPDDDLTPWLDDPVVHALRGPGTPDELADEAAYVAAFRAARSTTPTPTPTPAPEPTPIATGRLRRAGRRLGGGGTAVVVAISLGAGAAAAAYTQNLPDAVQRAVHDVLGPVGVPAPRTPGSDGPKTSPDPTSAAPDASESPSDSPTDSTGGPTSSASSSPSDSPTDSPSQTPTESPTESPSPSPTETPTETPTAAPVAPAAVTVSGTTHRAAPDEQVPLSGSVTAEDGTPIAGQQVALFQRQGPTWAPVAYATSDDTGAVSVTVPALTRTSVFRLGVGDTLTSQRWRIALTPVLGLTTTADGIVVTARGGQPGDQVSLFSRRPGPDPLVARSRLDAGLTATFQTSVPSKPLTLVARLPRTRAHAPAQESLRVLPPKPATMTAGVPDTTPGPGDQVTVSGTVSAADGTVLPGRQVWLMLRAAGGEWRRAGSATSDTSGSVSIPAGQIDASVAVRLRVGKVRSPVVRLQLQPVWSASVTPSGDGAVITGSVAGGTPGDLVLLRSLTDGRLTTVGQAVLAANGSVRFVVPRPERGKDRYRLVLERTPSHLRAMATVVVPAT